MREEVVNILVYVLLGMFIYAFVLPVIEQFSSVTVQWLENIKGKLMVDAQELQNKIIEIAKEDDSAIPETTTNVIGFAIPDEIDYEEDYDDDDDDE